MRSGRSGLWSRKDTQDTNGMGRYGNPRCPWKKEGREHQDVLPARLGGVSAGSKDTEAV